MGSSDKTLTPAEVGLQAMWLALSLAQQAYRAGKMEYATMFLTMSQRLIDIIEVDPKSYRDD